MLILLCIYKEFFFDLGFLAICLLSKVDFDLRIWFSCVRFFDEFLLLFFFYLQRKQMVLEKF